MRFFHCFATSMVVLFLTQSPYAQTFTDQTNLLFQPNLFSSGGAVAVADINNDGKDDIIRLDLGNTVNVEYQAGSAQAFEHYGFGYYPDEAWALAVGDANNDGLCDLLFAGYNDGAKLLLANNNGFGFAPGLLPGTSYFAQGTNFADINNDGWLDVFSCDDNAESRIWGNNGAGAFTAADSWINMATVPASDNSGNYGSTWTDFDNDGDLDLYIAKCRGGATSPTDPRRINQLFVNNGNNQYSELAGAYGLKIGWQSWTSDFQDIDNDGDLDCFITNHDYNAQLLRNDGTGHFTDISSQAGFGNLMGGFTQGIMRDFDNDGFVDVLTASNGRLFHNNGNGTFTEQTIPFPTIGSYAVGDLNHDGFLDVFAVFSCGYVSDCGTPDKLYLNNGNANHYLAVQLQGNQSNRKGVGARVEIHGAWGKQVREIRAGESYGISNSLTAHFGLGTATQINYLVVHWPSGVVDVVANPAPDQYLTLVEGSTNFCGSLAINAVPTTATAPPDAYCSGFSIGCANASVEGSFTLCNGGSSSLPIGLPVALYRNDPRMPGATLLDVVYTDEAVPTNGCLQFDFVLDASLLPGMGSHPIYLVANDNGTSALPLAAAPGSFTNECDLDNNFNATTLEIQSPSLDLGPDLDICDFIAELNAGNGFSGYLWQDGSTGPVFTASQSGSYSVVAMDGCGLQQTDTVQVALNFAPQFINLGDDYTVCPGDTVWLGVDNDFNYTSIEWQSTAGNVACPNCFATFAVVQQTTSYSVQARVGACLSVGSLDVLVNAFPALSMQAVDGNCGNAATITATPTGSGPFNYAWSNPNGTIGENAATIYPQLSGNYTVTVSDMYGCQTTGSASVQVGTVPQVSASLDPPTCSASTDGGIALAISGGNAPFSFLWSNSASTQNLTDVAAGTYSVTLTDVNQCIAVASYTLQSPPELLVTNYANSIACHGGTTTLSAQGWGGTPPYSYAWSNGELTSINYDQPAGSYSVTVTDAQLCMVTATTVLTDPSAISATTEVLPISCAGSTPGQITLSASGGVGQYSYVWSNGVTEAALTTLQPGDYAATITDGNGCTAVATASLPLNSALEITASQTPISCHPTNGNSMDGSITLSITGGDGSYAILWENGETSPTRTGLGAGDYSVTTTDGIGCTGSMSFSLAGPPQLDVVVQFTSGSCGGQSNGSATATASGGTPTYALVWENTQQVGTTAIGLAPGTYTVIATDANGCTDSDSVEIPLLQNDTTTMEISLCQGESSPLTSTEYLDPGEFTEQLLLSNYQGCDSVVLAEVTVHPEEELWVDNGPLPYGMEYHGVILTQDTQFILYDTTEFGCLLTISENVTVFPSATKETSNELGLLAYPSPFSDRLRLRFTLPRPMAVSIALHDALGRQVKSLVAEQNFGAGEHQMDWEMAGLPPGLYMLGVWADGMEAGRKVVKE